MARDTLDRQRLIDNLIERIERLEERVRRLEEVVGETPSGTVVIADGLILTHEDTGEKWRAALVTAGPEGVCLAFDEIIE